MTDTTHEAPERIWLTRDETYWQNDLGIVFTFQVGSHDVEYVPVDRIEALEAENKILRYMIIDQIEGAGDDPEIMAASRAEWAARAKAAEAYAEEIYAHAKELEAKLRDVEWRFEHLEKYGDTKDTREFATEALAKLTGGKDD